MLGAPKKKQEQTLDKAKFCSWHRELSMTIKKLKVENSKMQHTKTVQCFTECFTKQKKACE